VTDALAKKLATVQSELKAPKGQLNKFGGYHYRSCEDILVAVKPLLSQHGLYLTLDDEVVQVGQRYYVRATATVTDGAAAVTVRAYAREDDARKGMDVAQVTGSSSSYARKYALNGLFAIDDTRDADTHEPPTASNGRAASAAPARSQRPAGAAASRPAGELSVHDRVLQFESKLVANGLCQPGELVDSLTNSDLAADYDGRPLEEWPAASVKLVGGWCREWERQARAAVHAAGPTR